MEFGSQISKFVKISVKTCYKSFGNHPFVVGFLLFFIFLHRSFPLLFSVLVSSSPVLVCTAVLLGTLLSFGQSNIPEIESRDDIASLRTWVPGDDTVVAERGGSFSTQKFSSVEEPVALEAAGSTDDRIDGEFDVPILNENVHSTLENQGVDRDIEFEKQGLLNDVGAVEQQYTLPQKVRDQILQVQADNVSPRESVDAHRGEQLGSFRGGYDHDDSAEVDVERDIESEIQGLRNDGEAVEQQYTLLQNGRDQISQVQDDNVSPRESVDAHIAGLLDSFQSGYGEDSGEASDSESDGAESSSPDASMADILPILDELHPLLDLEAPQPAHDGSDAASDSSVESEEQGEQVDEDDGVDYNGGDEEDIPSQGDKEDESKSAIKWTDDDQKNLMNLGNLELERNQRLESLIARRRARKSFKLTAEKNLIDFDGFDLPFNVSPISTTRCNPFDSPCDDSYGNMQIPGSAPSILLARRNPFDLPYDSNEEKPDLKGDHFEQEFIALHANDAFFRRHESFSLGASSLGGGAKHERQNFKWKPVFVPERLALDGTDYSAFQRQSSGVSESKLSSVPDSDSASSVADLDDRKLSEQDFNNETEVISNIYHASSLVDHGSHSYEDVYPLEMEQADKSDVLHDQLAIELGERENLEPSLSDNGGLASLVTSELHLNPELIKDEDSSSMLSLSSLSEADEKIPDMGKGGENFDASGDLIKEFLISPQHSPEEPDVQFMSSTADENQSKEPVYDSVPLEAENLISLNSISSEMQGEISELVTTEASEETYVPFVPKDNDVDGENIEKITSIDENICGATSNAHGADAVEGDQSQVTCSVSDVEGGLPRNLEVNAAYSESSYHYLLSSEQTSEQDKDLTWLDKSMVKPHLDSHLEALFIEDNVKEEVEDIKEIDAELLLELDTVGDFSVKELVGEPLHYELITKEVNALSTESRLSKADSNMSEPDQELPVLEHVHEGADIDGAFEQIHEGVNGEEIMFPSVVDNELEVSERTVQSGSQLPTVEATSLEDIITSSNQAPDGSVNEFPQPLNTERSPELHLELPAESNEVSADVLPNVLEEVMFSSMADDELEVEVSEPTVQTCSQLPRVEATSSEDILASSNQAPAGTVNEFPQLLDSDRSAELHLELPPEANEVSADVLPDAVEEIMSGNIGSTVQETFTTHIPLKQLSDGNVAELPNQSNSNVVLAEVETEDMVESTESGMLRADSNLSEPDQELPALEHVHVGVNTDGAFEQMHDGVNGEVVTFPSVVDNELEVSECTVQTSSQLPTIELAYAEDTITSSIQAPDGSANEFPQPLDTERSPELHLELPSDGNLVSADVLPDAVEKIASGDIGSTVQETSSTHRALKQLSEGNVAELPSPSNSNVVLAEVETDGVVEMVSSNVVYGVEETSTEFPLKQGPEDDVCELPKASYSKDGCEEVTTNVGDSVEEIGLNNAGSGVQETMPIHIALNQVSGSIVAETIEIATGIREVVQEHTRTQVPEKNADVGELPKPSNSDDGLAEQNQNEEC